MVKFFLRATWKSQDLAFALFAALDAVSKHCSKKLRTFSLTSLLLKKFPFRYEHKGYLHLFPQKRIIPILSLTYFTLEQERLKSIRFSPASEFKAPELPGIYVRYRSLSFLACLLQRNHHIRKIRTHIIIWPLGDHLNSQNASLSFFHGRKKVILCTKGIHKN